MPTHVDIVARPRVDDACAEELFSLYSTYYANASRNRFLVDLARKQWIILLRTGAGKLAGFSTLCVFGVEIDHERCAFLYSGDTVVAQQYRQSSPLAGAFCHCMRRMLRERPDERCYWLLISKGFRTYRYLPIFFNSFFPVYARETPSKYRRMIDHVGLLMFGDYYDSRTGIVSYAGTRDYLRFPGDCEPDGRYRDAHVRFFLERNPGYARGDELVCVADINETNFGRPIHRVAGRTEVRWHE